MTRKRFRTPPTLPVETQCRGTTVPASREWLGLYSDALLELTHAYNYEQVEATDLTPEETAAAAYQQYLAWLDSTCAGGVPCPDPVFPDLETPIYRQNPTTGRWEYIGPDGWEEPSGENAIPDPADREEATVPLQECGAASNAANSLKVLYQNILAVYDSQVDPALNQIEMAAQIALAYGTIFGPISSSFLAYAGAAWETFTYLLDQVTMNEWTADWHETLVCILNKDGNIEMVGDKAHFDYFSVNNDLVGFILPVIDDYVKVRWQVWYLLQCIGPQGLDLAGGTTDVQGDCATCDTWCYTNTPEAIGAVLTQGYFNSSGHAVAASISNAWRISASLNVDTTDCLVKRFGYHFEIPGGYGAAYHYYRIIDSSPSSTVETSGYTGDYYTPDNAAIVSTTNPAVLSMYVGHNSAQHKITAITVYGTGINPFGIGSNC